jgi:hypothetical protein
MRIKVNAARIKRWMFILVLVSVGFWSAAQDPLIHEKKVYVSPEGKVYIHKGLPLYLRLSTSADESEKQYNLKSEKTSAYSNPMYLDAEGYNTIRSPWAVDTQSRIPVYPKQEIVYEIYADSKPPVASLHTGTSNRVEKDGKILANGSLDINLEAADEISGTEAVYYSLNGASYQIYSVPFNLQKEGEYRLRYYAVDHVGNAETPHEVNFLVDLTKPETKLEIKGDQFENIISGRSAINLLASDQGSGVDKIIMRMDDGNAQHYRTAILASAIAQGEHQLHYAAQDLTGNCEDEKTYNFYIDKTPPVMVQELIGKSFITGGKEYASGTNQIKITTFDNKAGVKEVFYSLNNAPYQRYEKPFYLSGAKGDLLLKAYAVDQVGNLTEQIDQGESFTVPYVDLTGPDVNRYFTGPVFSMRDTVFISKKTGIALKASDSESGLNRIEYGIDASGTMEYKQEFHIEEEGNHSIQVTGFDNVDNTSHTEYAVIVDNTGPEIFIHYSLPSRPGSVSSGITGEVFPGHMVVFISCTDNMVGYDAMYYSLNGAPEKKFMGPVGNFVTAGSYKLKTRALDKLGNESAREISFYIEK